MPIRLYGRARRRSARARDLGSKEPVHSTEGQGLKLLTLNVAHARRFGRHQALVPKPTLETNLERIAQMLSREQADVVALQEADGPSAWSGRFDHVEKLAELAGYEHAFRGDHSPRASSRIDLSYGTALLSRLPLAEPHSQAFQESWRDSKGFVAATIEDPKLPSAIDVVSIHLDFLGKRVRGRQLDQLLERFRERERPLVVMGDLNCEWSERRRSLSILERELALRPASAGDPTYPSWQPLRRLDWILISDELDFASYRTLRDRLSDHLSVLAEIVPRGAVALAQ